MITQLKINFTTFIKNALFRQFNITVNSIADHTVCGTCGVADKVSCLPFMPGLLGVAVGGTTSFPVSSSSVRRSSGIGTATLSLGFQENLVAPFVAGLLVILFRVLH